MKHSTNLSGCAYLYVRENVEFLTSPSKDINYELVSVALKLTKAVP